MTRTRPHIAADEAGTTGALSGQAWAFVADSPFLPERDGLHRETTGLLTAARDAGVLRVVVLPCEAPVDTAVYEERFGVPVVLVPRRMSPTRLLHPTRPYVVASRPAPRWLPARVMQAAPSVNGVVIGAYKSWQVGRRLATSLGVPAVMRQQNDEGRYHATVAGDMSMLRGAVYRWEARRIARDDARLANAPWLTGTADISMADAERRRALHGGRVAYIPTFAIDPARLQQLRRTPDGARRALFVGSLNSPTNQSALRWLLADVWPQVIEARPDAVLTVVGSNPPDAVRRWLSAQPAVDLHADVAEIGPYMETAAVAVNPAVTGAGVNIKMVEYLAAAVPVVSTSFAAAGLGLVPDQDFAVGDSSAEFAQAVVRMMDDPVAAERLGAAGKKAILDLMNPQQNLAALAAMLQVAE
jgi:polysaccharide biosynthesis protein PslH